MENLSDIHKDELRRMLEKFQKQKVEISSISSSVLPRARLEGTKEARDNVREGWRVPAGDRAGG
eukprot:180826-Hanusia_phi.AAC.8